MKKSIQINIFNAIRSLFNSLSYENKKKLVNILYSDNASDPDSYKQEIIDAKNSKEAYIFNNKEFENISKKMLKDEDVDIEQFRVKN